MREIAKKLVKKYCPRYERRLGELYWKGRRYIKWFEGHSRFKQTKKEYLSMKAPDNFKISKKDLYPIYYDWFENAGNLDGHYFLQDLWVAQQIYKAGTKQHYDIGSRVDGFISHCLSFNTEVTMIDIRPLPYEVPGLNFLQADAVRLSSIEDNTIQSLSSLHALEHFGLGRYGDKVDPFACFKAMRAMERILMGGGVLYLSVPVGCREKLCFNGHRVFNPMTIINGFSILRLKEFVYIKERKIHTVNDIKEVGKLSDKLGEYDCGIFVFEKPLSKK